MMRDVVVLSEVPKVLYLPPFITLCVCVCFWRRLHLCAALQYLQQDPEGQLQAHPDKGQRDASRVCVLMRDWHHARGASLVEECGSRQIDCSFTRSISPSTSLRHYTVSRHSCAVCIFCSFCVFLTVFVFYNQRKNDFYPTFQSI